MKMLTGMHMVVYTWWCWHICKGEGVGVGVDVDVDQLEEERKVFRCSSNTRMTLGVEYCFDPFLFWIIYSVELCSPLNKLSIESKII